MTTFLPRKGKVLWRSRKFSNDQKVISMGMKLYIPSGFSNEDKGTFNEQDRHTHAEVGLKKIKKVKD